MEELRITARPREGGGYDFTSYDAEELFRDGVRLVEAHRCAEAVERYDRIADEFPTSRYASPALYNAALCLQEAGQLEEAVRRYERLIADIPESPDVKHATLQLVQVEVQLEHWDNALARADVVLRRDDLSSDERMEAMARRAQALLGKEQVEEAAAQASSALSYSRTRPSGQEVQDVYYAAAASFVLGETLRKRAEAVTIPDADIERQKTALEERARLVLEAQREYFNTIRFTNADWAAAAGYRIGSMYDAFWQALMSAPVPPASRNASAQARQLYEEEYRKELARQIMPLLRHSVRYWELTLLMVERTGVRSPWTTRAQADLERVRQRLLEYSSGGTQPASPGAAGGGTPAQP